MLERPQPLRSPGRGDRRRRVWRWAATRQTPSGRALQAIGRADQHALLVLRTRGHSRALDRIVGGLGAFGEVGAGWLAIGGVGAVADPRRRSRWLAAGAAAPAGVLCNSVLKFAIVRRRPLIEEHPPLARAPSKLSFPSAHATSSVAAAIALGRVEPALRPPLLVLAAAICLSRPYLGMHYPSDVLAGVALGTVIGGLYPLPETTEAGNGEEAA